MHAAALALGMWAAALTVPPDPFPQLPSELACKLLHETARDDRAAIASVLDALCGPPEPGWCGPVWYGGGWRGDELRRVYQESAAIADFWMAAWWVRWPTATDEQREMYLAVVVAGAGGETAFWRGRFPLPLSLRRQGE